MSLEEELDRFPRLLTLMPQRDILEYIRLPRQLCPEEFSHIVPSIELGTEGPYLKSLFLVSDSFMCEVHLAKEKNNHFDYTRPNTIFNYRIQLSTHEVKRADEQTIEYQLAKITLLHAPSFEFSSVLDYVGTSRTERDEWLERALRAFPFSLMQPSP